ncbi:hypothetical protein [Saccharibacillus kuerlensis]|uniref:Lipoprotein n=1 Tax=Saccharibacillus kuerlensis TaxID=459527 RepID=A0ABQ2L964_9BACL|nr:hypothetical protein [Saccharibacillus kuerlensis]GGO05314.1 hypothetical protein GCM10010969_31580 [Saccharibacillus kuerlensis]
MKTYNRAASLIGVLLLSGALTACGNESETASQADPADDTTITAENNKEAVEDPAAADGDKADASNEASGEEADAAGGGGSEQAEDDSAKDNSAKGDADTSDADKAGTDASKTGADASKADIEKADPAKQGKKGAGSDRPGTDSFNLIGSGDTVKGKLVEGYGYALYAMEGFEFDAETNMLSMSDNPDYYAIVKPLESGYALATLRKQGQNELRQFGKVVELKGANTPEQLVRSRLFLSAEGGQGTHQYALWETPEKGYLLHIHMPEGADQKKAAELIYTSLSTIAD